MPANSTGCKGHNPAAKSVRYVYATKGLPGPVSELNCHRIGFMARWFFVPAWTPIEDTPFLEFSLETCIVFPKNYEYWIK